MKSGILIFFTHMSLLLNIAMICVISLKTRPSRLRSAFLTVLGVLSLWNVCTVLELDFRLATGVTYMLFINICYISICLIPVAVLYLGKIILQPEWKPRPAHALFIIIPIVSIAAVFTNPMHKLFFVEFSLYSSRAVYGAYYYFHMAYSYGCLAAGIVLMIASSANDYGIFSRQMLLLITGIVVALTLNILYSLGVGDLPFCISTIAFSVSLVCFSIAFLKYRFIMSLPITVRQIIDLISDGYLVVDVNRRILVYNKALLGLFPTPVNLSEDTELESFFGEHFPEGFFGKFLELQASAAVSQQTVSTETEIPGNGFMRVEITPVMRNNAHIGSIMLLRDITQSKLLIETTQAASRSKSDFLSNMSHEIRTPLSAIIGMISIGLSTDNAEKKNYCLERADGASKHLLAIINDVLDMSKIEANKFELSPSEFSLKEALASITDLANTRAEEKRQTLTVSISGDVPQRISSDKLHLSQVVTNLLSNATKFTPENGSISLDISKVGESGGNVTLRFEVADTGIGVSKEQQERLFKPFNQADASITGKFGGTGLGLAISKRIVELMDGEIWIESELGKGAKFIFTVVVAKLPDVPGEGDADFESNRSGKNYDFSSHCLLVAEDVEINREIMSAILEGTGVSIDFAENGRIAVSLFTENPDKYSLILMDINMPEMDGYEATREIRQLDVERAGKIPIIAMTANVFREDIEKCISSGMNDHTGKPIDTVALFGMLNKYLSDPEYSGAITRVHSLEEGLAWDDSLLTGHALVDMQHQRIYERASELIKACREGSDVEKLHDTLSFLVNHAIRHFTDEEALALEYEYPDYERHRKAHDKFRATISELHEKFLDGGSSAELSADINKVFVWWLVQHINQEDKRISAHIRSVKSGDGTA